MSKRSIMMIQHLKKTIAITLAKHVLHVPFIKIILLIYYIFFCFAFNRFFLHVNDCTSCKSAQLATNAATTHIGFFFRKTASEITTNFHQIHHSFLLFDAFWMTMTTTMISKYQLFDVIVISFIHWCSCVEYVICVRKGKFMLPGRSITC